MEIENVNTTESTISQSNDVVAESESEQITAMKGLDEGEVSAKDDDCADEKCEGIPFVTIRYNHNDVPLSEADAVTLAQKGMAYESLYPVLKRAAMLKGVDVKSFIKGFEVEAEENHRRRLVEKYGDDNGTIDELMEFYRAKREADISEGFKQRESAFDVEFGELKKEFPEIVEKSALPEEVLKAFDEGKDLLSAYLKYKFYEDKRIKAAKQKESAAIAAAAGKLSSSEAVESVASAFIKGVRG